MAHMLKLIQIELNKHFQIARSYTVEILADQLFFILGFLILTGLFDVAAHGSYDNTAQLLSLVGYLTWRVAGGGMVEVAGSIAEDAQWGTLEQVWLSMPSPLRLLLARSMALIIYYTLRVVLIGGVIMLLLRIPLPVLSPGAILIYLLVFVSPFGLALAIAGLHLAYKNVEAITYPLATILLFLTGALAPLNNIPSLYILSRFLPLSAGVDILREMLVQGETMLTVMKAPVFGQLLLNSAIYLAAGVLVFNWAHKRALADGSLAHY